VDNEKSTNYEIKEKIETVSKPKNPRTLWMLILVLAIGVGVFFAFMTEGKDTVSDAELPKDSLETEAIFKDETVGNQNTVFLTMQEETPGEFYDKIQTFELHLKKAQWVNNDAAYFEGLILENSNFDAVNKESDYGVSVEFVSDTIMKLSIDINGDASVPCYIQVPVSFEATHLGEATVEIVPLESAISADLFILADVTKK